MNGQASGAPPFWSADRIRGLAKPVAWTVGIVVGIWLLIGGFDWTIRIAGVELALRFGGVEGLFRYLCRGGAAPAATQAAAGGFWAVIAVAFKYAFIVGTPVALLGALRSRDPRIRAILFQIVVIALFVALVWYLVANTVDNLDRRQIRSGFDFLCSSYGSQIDETLIELDRKQPEFTLTFEEYIERVVPPARVERGRALLAQHLPLLTEIGRKFGGRDN